MDIEKPLQDRVHILAKAQNNKQLQDVLKETCKRDILYFFKNFLYTEKNSTFFGADIPFAVPFIPFEFQEEFITEIWSSIQEGTKPVAERADLTSVFIEKSRQMGITWLLMGIFMYGYLFYGHKYLIISRTGSEVDTKGDMKSCFEKLRFMIRHLPTWMLPEGLTKETGSEYNKYMTISRKDNTGSITGEAAGPDGGRGGTYSAVFLDEMAFMQDASAINKSVIAATPCRVINSTPNGEGNEYFRMKKLAMAGDLKYLRLHWKIQPVYDDAWYAWKTKGMQPEQIAQELEIDYNTAIEGRVYKEFKQGIVQFGEGPNFDYDYLLPLYVAIDNGHGGADPSAAIVFQTELNSDKIRVIDCVQINCTVTQFASIFGRRPQQGYMMSNAVLDFYSRYLDYKPAVFIADPYDSHSALNDTTIAKEYMKVGIHLTLPKTLKSLSGSAVEEQINITKNNIHRFKVHDRCTDFTSAIQNSRYPDIKETSQRVTSASKPIHDQFSHYRTALEYAMLYLIEQEEFTIQKQSVKPRKPKERTNVLTGEVIVDYI